MKIESKGVAEMGLFMLANKVTDLEDRVEKLEEMGEKLNEVYNILHKDRATNKGVSNE